ncbi:MAG: hypothetical protein KAS32_11430 [Candidatus Peribacteraceae bacterium]|nr:hypothetical protein [Candidatus Peribacteraceae bacterium]
MINILEKKYTYLTLPEFLDIVGKVAEYSLREGGPKTLETHEIEQQVIIICSYIKYELTRLEFIDIVATMKFDESLKEVAISKALIFMSGDSTEPLYSIAGVVIDAFARIVAPQFNGLVADMIGGMEWFGTDRDKLTYDDIEPNIKLV